MKRILVGVDTSAAAADALAWADSVGRAVGAAVRAVNACGYPNTDSTPGDFARLLGEREAELAFQFAEVADVDTVVRVGDPRQVLLADADAAGADLVVLGRTGGERGAGLHHLGGVVEHTAHHTSTALAVIPLGWWRPPARVVVGVDGSTASLRAVRWATELTPLDPHVAAVQVVEPNAQRDPASSTQNWRRDVEHDLERWVAPLTDVGLTVVPVAQRDPHTADGLMGVASDRGADLLVVGTSGLDGFTGLRPGGVALEVLHRAVVPLVLVPDG